MGMGGELVSTSPLSVGRGSCFVGCKRIDPGLVKGAALTCLRIPFIVWPNCKWGAKRDKLSQFKVFFGKCFA